MSMQITPHLNFRGQAREALEFYQSAFGGELSIATYADLGGAADEADAQKVIFGQVTAPSGFRIMAFDILEPRPFHPGESAFFVSARVTDADELTDAWATLSDGATVLVPLPLRLVARLRHAHRPLRRHVGDGRRHRLIRASASAEMQGQDGDEAGTCGCAR